MKKHLLLLTAAIALAGCEAVTPITTGDGSEATTEQLTFKPYKNICVGVAQRLCLEQTDGKQFYEAIEGFDFVWGRTVKIEVDKVKLENPPADGSEYRYIFKQIVGTPTYDVANTEYTIQQLSLVPNAFSKTDGNYFVYGEQFQCGPSNTVTTAQCDERAESAKATNTSGDRVNLTFVYLGQNSESEIKLRLTNIE